MPAPDAPFWQRMLTPFRLLYALIWRPSQFVHVPLVPFASLLLLCSLPLVVSIAAAGGAIGWFVILLACCSAAGLAAIGVQKGSVALLLIGGVVALARPPRLVAGIAETFRIPSAGQLIGALLVCSLLLACTIGIGAVLGRLRWRWPTNLFATCGGSIVALLALIIADQNNDITALAMIFFGLTLLPLVFGKIDGVLFCFTLLGFIFAVFGAITVESRVLVPFAGLVGFLLAYLMRPVLQIVFEWSVGAAPREVTLGVVQRASAPLIAVLLIVIAVLGGLLVAGVSVLPAPLFLLVCWFAGLVGLGMYETDWKNMLLLLLIPAIGIETQGLAVAGLGLLAVLIGGYRLPEYLVFACISMRGRRARAEQAERWLRWLPPWWSEHLWLPLPGHAALLHAALEHNSSVAFDAVRRMRALGQPGVQRTLLAALPSLVRVRLAQVQTPQEIAALDDGHTSPLAMLVGALITAGEWLNIGRNRTTPPTRIRLRPAAQLPWERRRRRVSPLAADVTLVLPGLCRVAKTVAAALAPPVDPRERAIAQAQVDLRGGIPDGAMIAEYMQHVPPQPTLQDARSMLEHLAAALAADAAAAHRWQPVITHWRAVLHPV